MTTDMRAAPSVDGDSDPDLVAVAAGLTGLLDGHAGSAAEYGHPVDEVIEAVGEAGLFQLLAPRSRGGAQASVNTLNDVHEQLARGCGSTAWVTAIYNASMYLLEGFTEAARDEVYATPHPKVMGTFNPTGGAEKVQGGYLLSGTWRFCSGEHHADWGLLASFATGPDGVPADSGSFLVPRADWRSLGDWQVSGLAGTGSVAVSTDRAFVPDHRTHLRGHAAPAPAAADEVPYYGLPVVPFFASASSGTPLGLASAALDLMMERIHKRGITYTQYDDQAQATITHLQLDEAFMKLDQARFHARRSVATVREVAKDPANLVLRARCRADIAWIVKLCKEVVDVVQQASGASAIHRKDPLSRIVADIAALSVHALHLHASNAELYGRVLAGLEPGTTYV